MAHPSSHEPVIRTDQEGHHAIALFPRDVTSVSSARAWLARFLAPHSMEPNVSADATLVLSELVTNALRYGVGDIVTLGSLDEHAVRVAVTDSGDELPEVQPIESGRIGGLGLHVVTRVADTWGVAPFPGGKTVWASLRRRRS